MRNAMAAIGPCVISRYARKDFTDFPSGINWHDVWSLVGPTVEVNLPSNPLWKVFCVLYLEGLMHGVDSTKLGALQPPRPVVSCTQHLTEDW
jgi:hypothetical protein